MEKRISITGSCISWLFFNQKADLVAEESLYHASILITVLIAVFCSAPSPAQESKFLFDANCVSRGSQNDEKPRFTRSASGRFVAVNCFGPNLGLFDLKRRVFFSVHLKPICRVMFDQDDQTLFVLADHDGQSLYAISLSQMSCVEEKRYERMCYEPRQAYDMSLLNSRGDLLYVLRDEGVYRFRRQDRSPEVLLRHPNIATPQGANHFEFGFFGLSMSLSPCGQYCLVGGATALKNDLATTLVNWDINRKKITWSWHGRRGWINCVVSSPHDGQYLTLDNHGEIHLIDISRNQVIPIGNFEQKTKPTNQQVNFSSDGNSFLVVAQETNRLHIFESCSGLRRNELALNKEIFSAVFGSKPDEIIVLFNDCTAHVISKCLAVGAVDDPKLSTDSIVDYFRAKDPKASLFALSNFAGSPAAVSAIERYLFPGIPEEKLRGQVENLCANRYSIRRNAKEFLKGLGPAILPKLVTVHETAKGAEEKDVLSESIDALRNPSGDDYILQQRCIEFLGIHKLPCSRVLLQKISDLDKQAFISKEAIRMLNLREK